MIKEKYIEVNAGVRYWEDAILNGQSDEKGEIPLRRGDCWSPVINLFTGEVLNWPDGYEAQVHYKVCDAGEYWILDENKNRILKWKDYYVPNDFLCVKKNGYGDYIILNILKDGKIENWKTPYIDEEKWIEIELKNEE